MQDDSEPWGPIKTVCVVYDNHFSPQLTVATASYYFHQYCALHKKETVDLLVIILLDLSNAVDVHHKLVLGWKS